MPLNEKYSFNDVFEKFGENPLSISKEQFLIETGWEFSEYQAAITYYFHSDKLKKVVFGK